MSKAIEKIYSEKSVNYKRLSTDKLFIHDKAIVDYVGHIDDAFRFIEGFDLLKPELWARFVEQFRINPDDADCGWRGEYWGKMMRGASFVYSYTRNEKLLKVLTDTVEDILTTIDDLGRISSYSVDAEFNGWDMWSRKYVLLGMQYFMEICEDENLNARLIEAQKKQVDYIISKVGTAEGKTPITKTSFLWKGLNSSSILEPVVRLYDLTGEQKYLDFATEIIKCGGVNGGNIFELAFQNEIDPYQYPVVKAYEMISCFEGLLEYYRATGAEDCLTAVLNFARRLGKSDITIIGSAGCTHELLDHSAARQTDTAYEGIMQETCVTVTWMKLCLQLLAISGEAEFAEYFEQSLYNAYLGSVNTEKNVNERVLLNNPTAILEPLPFDSYSSLRLGTRGRGVGGFRLMPDNHYYGCCACIGAAGIGMVHKAATMLSENGITLNLYINGKTETLTPNGNPLTLKVDTLYPAEGRIEITLDLEKKEAFDLTLRVPSWSEQTALSVCGETSDVNVGYNTISREWKNGDKIVLNLDMRAKVILPPSNPTDVLHVDLNFETMDVIPKKVTATPEAKYHIALRRGPLVLARDARLGENVDEAVHIKHDENGVVELKQSDSAKFPTIVEFKVPTVDGGEFTVIDYSSAGKTWREDSKYGCWLPTKK